MGKNRVEADKKIDAFEREISDYARKNGRPEGFILAKQAKRDLVHVARDRKITIDVLLEQLRPQMMEAARNPTEGLTVFPLTMPTVH